MVVSRSKLRQYRAKRNFSRTNEPVGRISRKQLLDFVVQKHAARRLHYDFRLEWEGVLLSWAVTKEPSADPSLKRLAVRTEDHPVSYKTFEGTIPQGEYGAGTVVRWDEGIWEPLNDVAEGLERGKLHFNLHGKRMTGSWTLIRMQKNPKQKSRENWLLIKNRDTKTRVEKNARKRKILPSASDIKIDISANRDFKSKSKKNYSLKQAKLPVFRKPQLALLMNHPPPGDDWLHEVKFDGYRCLTAIAGDKIKCYTRSGQDWSEKFRGIPQAVAALDCVSALLDGEIIAPLKRSHRSSFSALQKILAEGERVDYMVFDLLELDGKNLQSLPLLARKSKLQTLLQTAPEDSPLKYSEHVQGSGIKVFHAICAAGGEGIISKNATAPYLSSQRSRDWQKIKCTKRQEFIVGGYSPSNKKGRAFASLLIGSFQANSLCYRGRVGSGFSEKDLTLLANKLRPIAKKQSPFDAVPALIARDAHWVQPRLVVEIDFTEFTADGAIRHGVFLGLRNDKPALEVKDEEIVPRKSPTTVPTLHGIRLSHPGRVVYPAMEITKYDMAHYYDVINARMLPYCTGHLLSLLRCPQGRAQHCFYQKHVSEGFPAALPQTQVKESAGACKKYWYMKNVAGLIAAVQMGTLEFHIWGSRQDKVEKPDRLVFDLDPDASLNFSFVREAAFQIRDRLETLGLKSFAMLTGGKGIHVVAPMRRIADWRITKAFAKAFATTLAESYPDLYTANLSKRERQGKIFIDWLRNQRGATAICPYSTRARANAPVATPVSWEELHFIESASQFSIGDVLKRIKKPDPWSSYKNYSPSITEKKLRNIPLIKHRR